MIKTLFDNLNEFSANDFATLYSNLFNNGVIVPFADNTATTTALKVTNDNGNVAIGDGSAMINGRTIIVSGETVPLDTDGTYQIVLEWSAAADSATLKALSDTETLTQNSMFYQLPLALVVKSGTSLTITDLRSFVNRISDTTANDLYNIINTGWVPITAEVSPNLEFNLTTGGYDFYLATSTDLSDKIKKGTKLKIVQGGTVKYFIVVDVHVNAASSTLIALYGGTDYELTWDTISSAYCSNTKSPIGFPLDPDKWSVKIVNTSLQDLGSTTANSWKSTNNSIVLPVGSWQLSYKCQLQTNQSTNIRTYVALSTSASNATDTDYILTVDTVNDILAYYSKNVIVNKTTRYYLIFKTYTASSANYLHGDDTKTEIKAVCAYL